MWEVQTVAFSMLGDAISRVGSSFPADVWKSTVEVEISFPFLSYIVGTHVSTLMCLMLRLLYCELGFKESDGCVGF